jgi:hypothetical protein
MQEARNAALARGGDDHFRAVAIHRIEIALLGYPHTGKAREVINLCDVTERLIDQCRIKHGTCDIFDLRDSAGWRAKIQNPHLSTAVSERRYEVLADEAGAASDKYPGHECGSGPT